MRVTFHQPRQESPGQTFKTNCIFVYMGFTSTTRVLLFYSFPSCLPPSQFTCYTVSICFQFQHSSDQVHFATMRKPGHSKSMSQTNSNALSNIRSGYICMCYFVGMLAFFPILFFVGLMDSIPPLLSDFSTHLHQCIRIQVHFPIFILS